VCGVNTAESRKIRSAKLGGLWVGGLLADRVPTEGMVAGVLVVDEIGAGESIAPTCVLPTDGAN
jgi:hypothetical protein